MKLLPDRQIFAGLADEECPRCVWNRWIELAAVLLAAALWLMS